MRVLVILFAINVVVGIWIWTDLRSTVPSTPYRVADHVIELGLKGGGRDCRLVGPFLDEGMANQVHGYIESLELPVSLVQREIEKAPRYWVYYGPMSSYAEALDQSRKFKEERIDNFIITREDLYGAISLGVFENIDSAQRMQAQMRRKGYQTSVRNIFKFESQWWVEFAPSQNGQKIIKIRDLIGDMGLALEMREFLCKTVAT